MLQKLDFEYLIVVSEFLSNYNEISSSKWNRFLRPATNLCW